jgi:hypothetical protein
MRLRSLCAALSLLTGAKPAIAQRGTPHLDGRRLPLQVDTFAISVIQGKDTVQTGTLVDALRADGNHLMRIYNQNDRVLGPHLDTIISELPGLKPLAYRSLSLEGIKRLTFAGATVSGWTRLPNGDSVTVKVPLPPIVYDGTSYDLVIRASDLSEKFVLTVPAFVAGPNTVSQLTGRVTGSAMVDGHACWVFVGNFTGMPVTFWIDKTTRALRRQLMQPRVGLGILFGSARAVSRASRSN